MGTLAVVCTFCGCVDVGCGEVCVDSEVGVSLEGRLKPGGRGAPTGPFPHVNTPIEEAPVLVLFGGVNPSDDKNESCAFCN